MMIHPLNENYFNLGISDKMEYLIYQGTKKKKNFF